MFRFDLDESNESISGSSESSSIEKLDIKRQDLPKCICKAFLSSLSSRFRGRLRKYCSCAHLSNKSHLD